LKKKVAVFANGWNSENVYKYLKGLQEYTPDHTIDYFVFLCHATYGITEELRNAMNTIYTLPDLSTFDAAIIFYPGINFENSIEYIYDKAEKAGIPVISIGRRYKDFYHIGIDNYVGMKELVNHLIEEHDVKTVQYIAGSRENFDSNERLRAVKDAFYEHNMSFSDDEIFYSNWELLPTTRHVMDMFEEGQKMPRAFICANDKLAESVSYALENCNIPTPEEVIVTGFDYIDEGQLFYPSIASVDQQYSLIGKASTEMLVKIFDGTIGDKKDDIIQCKFCLGESCGCQNTNNENERRRMYARGVPRKNILVDQMEGRRNRLESAIISATNFENLQDGICDVFTNSRGLEGDSFYYMVDPELRYIPEREKDAFPKFQYAEEMLVFLGKSHGKRVETKSIKTVELIPEYDGEDENHIYVFLALYFDAYVYGYLTFVDILDWIISDNMFYKFERSVAKSIILYKRNVQVIELNKRLSELMEKDPLTNVKNRIAYERYVSEMQKKYDRGEVKEFAVAFFDINNLKFVNDTLGHESGDIYIRNCCRLICNSFKHCPIFRIGGDEFVSFISGEDYDNREAILTEMRAAMRNIQKETDRVLEHVSFASGMAEYDSEIDNDFKSVFKRADNLMYKNKAAMKKEYGNSIR